MADEFRAFSEVWRTPRAKTLRARLPGWSEPYPSHRGYAYVRHLMDPLKAAGADTQCAAVVQLAGQKGLDGAG